MSTFAVTNSDELLPAVNYLLSNLDTSGGQGNVVIPGNVLVANTTTGVVSQSGNSTVFGYLYQYVNLRYSNNATGTAGFSASSDNFEYFGVFNSAGSSPSNNPAAYQWYEVDPPFDSATSRTLYYSAIGGRQIQWAAASSPPSTSYQVTTANVAIDLDVVTTATGTPGDRGPVVMAGVITTADPTTATAATLTGWFEASRSAASAPIGTGLTPVAGDTASFTWAAGPGAPQAAYEYNGSIWVPVNGQVISGNVIVQGTIAGNAMIANTITATQIATGTITATQIAANTITAGQIAANTITAGQIAANTITAGQIAANTITAGQIAANTITAGQIAANTITAGQIAANTITGNRIAVGTITTNNFTANTINGNILSAGTVTANLINANGLIVNTVVSSGATLGSNTSPGFWMDGTTGNARFGNSISIGNQLTVGSGANIGAGLIVGSSANIGTNLVVGANATVGANLIVGSGANIGTNLRVGSGANIGTNLIVGSGATIGTSLIVGSGANIGANLVVGNNASIGGNLTVAGLITGSNLLANTVVTNTVVPGSITTTPIIINNSTAYPGSSITSGIPFFLAGGQAVTYTSNDFVIVLNSSYSIQFSGGIGTGTLVDIDMIRTLGGNIWTALGRVSWSPGGNGYLNLSSAGLTQTYNQGLVAGQTYSFRPQITLIGTIPTNLTVSIYWTIQILKR